MAATNESIAKKKNNANVISLFMAGAKKDSICVQKL